MRQIALTGIIILLIGIIASAISYLNVQEFHWTPYDAGFIYSLILTIGFIVSLGAGLFGALKENEEFLITGGTACIALSLLNKLFSNLLYSWNYLDISFLMAGTLMIIDRFHVKSIKSIKKSEEPTPEQLLEKLDKLKANAGDAEYDEESDLFKEIEELEILLRIEGNKRPDLTKKLRFRLLQNTIVQDIVTVFLASNNLTIEPTIEFDGSLTYSKFPNLKEYSKKKIQATLDKLVSYKILLKELYEKVTTCPQCHNSSKIFFRNECPKCGSHTTRMSRLLEHIRCGAIYKEEEVPTEELKAKCPKCGKTIKEELEIKPVGTTFECDSCKSIFSDPLRIFYCRKCSLKFNMEDCEYIDTYSYKLNEEFSMEIRKSLIVLTTVDTIQKLQFEVLTPGFPKGKSGISHEFTITCIKNSKLTVIDLLLSEVTVNLQEVLTSYAKFDDIVAAKKILIAIPTLENNAQEFLKSSDIVFIEGKETTSLNKDIKKILSKIE